MACYATPIHELQWGNDYRPVRQARPVEPIQPLYPMRQPFPEPIIVHNHLPAPVNPPPLQNVAVSSVRDVCMLVLFLIVVALAIVVVHMNARINSLQALLNYVLLRSGRLMAPV